MTAPSEEQVRAWLRASIETIDETGRSVELSAPLQRQRELYRAALAILDAGRKDRERVDWLEGEDGSNPSRMIKSGGVWHYTGDTASEDREGETLRAAIDRARGA